MVSNESPMVAVAQDPDFDDGATEVVAAQPRRRGVAPIEIKTIAKKPAGGRVKSLTEAGDASRRDFIILRKVGAPAAKIAMTHAPVFKALWEVWQGKRTAAEPDPGVAIAEITEVLNRAGTPLAISSISSALRSLTRNNVVRSIDEHVGWRSRRTRYYPTSAGVEAYALAEVLGDGSFVQVGQTTKSWRYRDQGEPLSLFQHAALLRGWADPADPVEK